MSRGVIIEESKRILFESDNKRNKLIISDILYDILVVLVRLPNRESKSLLGHTSTKKLQKITRHTIIEVIK